MHSITQGHFIGIACHHNLFSYLFYMEVTIYTIDGKTIKDTVVGVSSVEELKILVNEDMFIPLKNNGLYNRYNIINIL
jgi:hypothetical protein